MLNTESLNIYLIMRTFLFRSCVDGSGHLTAFYLYLSRQPIQFDSVDCRLKYFLLQIKFKAYKHSGTFCYDTWALCVFIAL